MAQSYAHWLVYTAPRAVDVRWHNQVECCCTTGSRSRRLSASGQVCHSLTASLSAVSQWTLFLQAGCPTVQLTAITFVFFLFNWPFKCEIDSLLATNQQENKLPLVDCDYLQTCISQLKYHKAGGYDGIANEHIICGGDNLLVHLCLLFNALIKHCFVPGDFCFGMIVPLLKSKHGDSSQIDMISIWDESPYV